MPAVSRAQRVFFAIAEHHPEQLRGKKPKMSKEAMHDFAATPERGLPAHVSKHRRFRPGLHSLASIGS